MKIDEFILEVNKLGLNPTKLQLEQLNKYYELLIEWNNFMNLTGIVKKEEVYLKHFYDSLTIIKIIDLNNFDTLCDIGSGAGFPGIVLKIFYPHLKITLVDSLNKRINFLNNIIKELSLNNIEAKHSRIEEFNKKNSFDIVTARAVSALNILIEYSIPLLKKDGYAVFLKANITEEINNSKNALKQLECKIEDTIEFKLPKENSLRTIIKIKKIKINNKYPRKYNEIKKKPL